MSKHFNYIVSGNLTVQVEAKNKKEAQNIVDTYMDNESPLNDWEIYDEPNEEGHFDTIDLKIKKTDIEIYED